MERFLRKPVEVEAVQFDGKTSSAYKIVAWVLENGGNASVIDGYPVQGPATIRILTLDGDRGVIPGEWVVRDGNGEFHSCANDIFLETYEAVND